MVLRTAWIAFAVFVPLVIITNLAVLLPPHTRGLGFPVQLRYTVMTLTCALCALTATLLFQWLQGRTESPRWALAALLAAGALVASTLLGISGPRGLFTAAAPATVATAAALALLVPRLVERPPHLVGTIAIVAFGLLELVGVFAAVSSERVHAPAGRMAFEVPRVMFDVEHKFVDLPSAKGVHYVDEGQGRTLLFLHGNPAWSFQWRELVVGLRGRYRCVAPDYPGFGLSPSPEGYGFTPREQSRVVEELVDALGLTNVTLVMQDWGGPIGLGLAGRRPSLVRGIILGNTWAWPTTTAEPRGKFSIIAGGPIGEFAQINFNGFASFGLKHGVIRELPDDVVEMYLRPFQPLERHGIAIFYPRQITDATEYMGEVEAGLGRVRDRRALIFWGVRDAGSPPSDKERFQRLFPAQRTVEFDADHFFFEDEAKAMIREIAGFMEGEQAPSLMP